MSEGRLPGNLAERYELLELLGRGAMGAVFRVRDRELGRFAALKVLTQEPRGEVLERFQREARVMATLRHPHIAELYDYGIQEGQAFLVMELLDGSDLKASSRGSDPLPWMVSVAEALDRAHRDGVVHRDVKPENILVTREGRAVLTDFGLAREEEGEALTCTGAAVGTLAYMSPEVLSGEGSGPATDWWAWGVTLFACLEGRLPFGMEDLPALGPGRKGVPEIPFEKISEGVRRTLIERSLVREIPDRLGGLEEIRRILDPGVSEAGGASASASGSSSRSRSRPRSRSRSGLTGTVPRWSSPGRLSLLLGAAFLLGSSVLLLLLVRDGREASGSGARGPGVRQAPGETRPPNPGGEALARELREELADLGRHFRGPEGQVRRFQGEAPPHDWEEVLSPDPADWGLVRQRLPRLARVLAALRGDPGAPDLPLDLRALREVDAYFVGQGLPRPFHPWLYLEPPGSETREFPIPSSWDFSGREQLGDHWNLSPRGFQVVTAYSRASKIRAEMLREIERAKGGGDVSPHFPGSLASESSLLGLASHRGYLRTLWHQPSSRRLAGEWTRPLGEAIHSFLVLAAADLAEDGADHLERSLRWSRLLEAMRWWQYTYLGRLPLEDLLGPRVETPGRAWLRFLLLSRRWDLEREYGWPRGDLLERARDELGTCRERILRRFPGSALAADVRSRVVLFEFEAGAPGRLLEAYREGRSRYLEYPGGVQAWRLLGGALWAGQRRSGESDALTPSEIAQILDWFRREEPDRSGSGVAPWLQEALRWGRQQLE